MHCHQAQSDNVTLVSRCFPQAATVTDGEYGTLSPGHNHVQSDNVALFDHCCSQVATEMADDHWSTSVFSELLKLIVQSLSLTYTTSNEQQSG
jgi:hypothetical protein